MKAGCVIYLKQRNDVNRPGAKKQIQALRTEAT